MSYIHFCFLATLEDTAGIRFIALVSALMTLSASSDDAVVAYILLLS